MNPKMGSNLYQQGVYAAYHQTQTRLHKAIAAGQGTAKTSLFQRLQRYERRL